MHVPQTVFCSVHSLQMVTAVQILDQGISSAGIPYSYGFAIILLTVLVKLATYPLSKQQVNLPLLLDMFTCLTVTPVRDCIAVLV